MTGSSPSRGHALVTGASRGIGRALARRLAADDWPLVLVARTESTLQDVAEELRTHVPVRLALADLSDAGERERLAGALSADGVRVGALINNAGIGSFGPFASLDRERELDMIRLNVEAVTDLTHRFLPGMIEAGTGHILNVASTAAFQPGPLMAVYYATKAYVLSFSEALAEEVADRGVTVTCLCPGPTRTAFHERAEMERSRLLSFRRMDADDVARRGYRGMLEGERVVVPGLLNRLGALATRFLPRKLLTGMVKRLQAPVG